jgi:D-amino-acid dehydrogenase
VQIIVIGCGLLGLTSAYFLRQRGHDLIVLDRCEGPALETSYANGALLTPSMAEPWNTPGCWRLLLSSIGRTDSPLQLRLRALPGMIGWGVSFLQNSNRIRFARSAEANLRLSLHSLGVMKTLRDKTGIQYDRVARGTLRMFRNEAALDIATRIAEQKSQQGLPFRRLGRAEAIAIEPALEPIAAQLVGCIHYESDEVGDAFRFCVELRDILRQAGVVFRFNTTVSSIETKSGQVASISSGGERLSADAYVVAAGSFTAPMLRSVGIDVPVRPGKGYSITFDAANNTSKLRIPVVDDDLHAAVVPVGGALRAAGTAEFAGFDLHLTNERIRNLQKLVQKVLPEEGLDPSRARPWCGLRPMSVDGVPIIGPTAVHRLFVNTGHGHLGWTMATGSGELLAQLVSGETPSIDAAPYALHRFQ